MSSKHNIEKILAIVSAVEANDQEAGTDCRRLVEFAEQNWNNHPENFEANKANYVVKALSADDLLAAAEPAGLIHNENALAFINMIKELPEDAPLSEAEIAKAKEADEQRAAEAAARTERAGQLMSKVAAHINEPPAAE